MTYCPDSYLIPLIITRKSRWVLFCGLVRCRVNKKKKRTQRCETNSLAHEPIYKLTRDQIGVRSWSFAETILSAKSWSGTLKERIPLIMNRTLYNYYYVSDPIHKSSRYIYIIIRYRWLGPLHHSNIINLRVLVALHHHFFQPESKHPQWGLWLIIDHKPPWRSLSQPVLATFTNLPLSRSIYLFMHIATYKLCRLVRT